MDQPAPYVPAEPGMDPLAIASVVLGVVGVAVYCCGSFMCLGWIGFGIWLIGAVLGGVAAAKNQGTNRIIGVVGVVINVVPLLAAGAMMVLGVGAGLISGMINH